MATSSSALSSPLQTGSKKIKIPRRVHRDTREFDNIKHPGVKSDELFHTVHGFQVGERGPYPGTLSWDEPANNEEELCHNCGWSIGNEKMDHYTSRVKIGPVNEGFFSAMWDLGKNGPWILKDTLNSPDDAWTKDYITQKIIRERMPSLPLVEMHKYDGPDNNYNFIMMARAEGHIIEDVLHTLTEEDLADVQLSVKQNALKWRQITSPIMTNLDGSEQMDGLIGNCTGIATCLKTGQNEDEWIKNLTPGIRKGLLRDLYFDHGRPDDKELLDRLAKEANEKTAELVAHFPRGQGPYVLTHNDLHCGNIFISNDNAEKKWKVTAVIDWELAGFYPWWAEYFRANWPNGFKTEDLLDGHTTEEFSDISRVVKTLIDIWRDGNSPSKHGISEANIWQRKPFSACHPFAQTYKNWLDFEHWDYFEPDSDDSADDAKTERWSKWLPEDKKCMRWMKKVQEEAEAKEHEEAEAKEHEEAEAKEQETSQVRDLPVSIGG